MLAPMSLTTAAERGPERRGEPRGPGGWRWRDAGPTRTALWCVGAVSVAVALARAVHAALVQRQLDLAVYIMGASHIFHGDLYRVTLSGTRLPFTYPPFASVLFLPFTVLTRDVSQVTWNAICTGLLVAFVAVSLRAVRPTWRRSDIGLWALVLTYPAMVLEPVGLTFSFGQINILIALLVLADLTATWHIDGHRVPRGVMTGIAAASKLTPLIFVPYLFLTRQFRAAWTATATFVALATAMAVVEPAESKAYWTDYVLDVHRIGNAAFISNQSVHGALVRATDGRVSQSALVLAAVGVGAVGLAVATWAQRTSSDLLGILVCATTGLAASPISWAHHLVWVVPVVLWLALADDRPAHGRIWAATTFALFWSGAIWRIPYDRWQGHGLSFGQLVVGDAFLEAMAVFVAGVAVMLAVRRWWPNGDHPSGNVAGHAVQDVSPVTAATPSG